MGTGSFGGEGTASPSVAASSSHSRRSRGWTRGGRLPGAWPRWRCCRRLGRSGSSGRGGWSWCLQSSPCRLPGAGFQSGGEVGRREGEGTAQSDIPSCDALKGLGPLVLPSLGLRVPFTGLELHGDVSALPFQACGFFRMPRSCPSSSAFITSCNAGVYRTHPAGTTCAPHGGEGHVWCLLWKPPLTLLCHPLPVRRVTVSASVGVSTA